MRRFKLSDAEAMFKNWANDLEVTKYLMWPDHKEVSVSESVLKENGDKTILVYNKRVDYS